MKQVIRNLLVVVVGLVVPVSLLLSRALEMPQQSFWQRVNQSQVAVVQFYDYSKTDKSQRLFYSNLKKTFNAVSNNSRFNYANITFMMVNVEGNRSLLREVGVNCNCLPTLLIFVDGRPHGDKLCGMQNAVTINQFIENNLSGVLQNRICDRKEHDEKIEDAKLAAWAYWGPWWYGGFYGPQYSYGFGWGFPGRCGGAFMGGWNCRGNSSCYCAPYR